MPCVDDTRSDALPRWRLCRLYRIAHQPGTGKINWERTEREGEECRNVSFIIYNKPSRAILCARAPAVRRDRQTKTRVEYPQSRKHFLYPWAGESRKYARVIRMALVLHTQLHIHSNMLNHSIQQHCPIPHIPRAPSIPFVFSTQQTGGAIVAARAFGSVAKTMPGNYSAAVI